MASGVEIGQMHGETEAGMSNHYPDGHNVGVGMAYDTPEEKEMAKLEATCQRLRVLAGELHNRWTGKNSQCNLTIAELEQRLKEEGVPCD